MIDALAKLIEQHAGFANIPAIAFLLLFSVLLFYFGFRNTPYFWPGRIGTILTVCYQTGCGLILLFCLTGCAYLVMQSSIARHEMFINPVLLGLLVLAWLLVIVPCVMRDENQKRAKRLGIPPTSPALKPK